MLEKILKECINIIKNEGYTLPKDIKIKVANDYYKDKPFSPSYVDRDNRTVYVMSSIKDKSTIKRLVLHELIHLTNMKDYNHDQEFKRKTDLINKKYHLHLPYAAEDLLDSPKFFRDNPYIKSQAYKIVSKNSGIPINKLNDKMVYKGIPIKLSKTNYFNY